MDRDVWRKNILSFTGGLFRTSNEAAMMKCTYFLTFPDFKFLLKPGIPPQCITIELDSLVQIRLFSTIL